MYQTICHSPYVIIQWRYLCYIFYFFHIFKNNLDKCSLDTGPDYGIIVATPSSTLKIIRILIQT